MTQLRKGFPIVKGDGVIPSSASPLHRLLLDVTTEKQALKYQSLGTLTDIA